MNTYHLVGYQDLNFKTDDGTTINGINIFVISDYPDGTEGAYGRKTEKKFINRETYNRMKVNMGDYIGHDIHIFCDLKGKVVLIQPAK